MPKLKKILKITGIVVGVLLLIWGFDLIRTRRMIANGDLIKWDGQWYTKEQLAKKYPPQYIEVPAKNTPEEVYARFREALLKNDLEVALGEMVLDQREKYREIFANKEKLEKYKTLPEPNLIKKGEILGNFASYSYKESDKATAYSIDFQKNSEGYWQIDSI